METLPQSDVFINKSFSDLNVNIVKPRDINFTGRTACSCIFSQILLLFILSAPKTFSFIIFFSFCPTLPLPIHTLLTATLSFPTELAYCRKPGPFDPGYPRILLSIFWVPLGYLLSIYWVPFGNQGLDDPS